jgi:hypothetical protein
MPTLWAGVPFRCRSPRKRGPSCTPIHKWRTLVTNKTADVAVELAVDCGWLLADGDKGVCLTEEGRSLVRKELS